MLRFPPTLRRWCSCSGHEQHQGQHPDQQQQEPAPAAGSPGCGPRLCGSPGWAGPRGGAAVLADQSTGEGPVRPEAAAAAALTNRGRQVSCCRGPQHGVEWRDLKGCSRWGSWDPTPVWHRYPAVAAAVGQCSVPYGTGGRPRSIPGGTPSRGPGCCRSRPVAGRFLP